MLYEYLLISVVIASGYWGWFFVRRQPTGTPTFGVMHLAAAGLAGLGLLGRKYDAPWLGIAGAIGLGAGVCLLIVGPIVRGLARRFAASERLGVASWLLDIAEILAPGSGVAEEKAVLGAMKEIRDGRVEQTVDALVAAKDRAPAEARLAIDERIALLYIAAYRWSDAIAHAEAHLFGAIAPESGPPEAPASLREALGISPPVWVELLGAYGRTGDLDQAARMLARLEDVCAGRDDAALWIHRGRLMFLALAGRPASVRALVAPRRARHMSRAARSYWVAVAHEHGGDREAATAAYAKARARSRGRQTERIDQALARLADPGTEVAGFTPAAGPGSEVAGFTPAAGPGSEAAGFTPAAGPTPTQLSPIASDVVARVEAAPLPAPVRMARAIWPWAAIALTASVGAVAVVVRLAIGPSGDPGVLVRDGALVRVLVDAGEWWRVVSCIFIHVGVVHLAVNIIGLYLLARICEELFGGARTIALFGLAGLAGAAASYVASPAGVSAGASGAVFGLLGAVFVELTVHRAKYRAAWKRGLWGGLAVVTVAQIGVGFVYPVIDQWAHGGGLVGGAVAAVVLSPSARWTRLGVHLGRAIALVFGGFAITAAVLVARTSVADSLERGPLVRHVLGDIAVTAPATWASDGELTFSDGLVIMHVHRDPRQIDRVQVDAFFKQVADQATKRGFDRVEVAPDHAIALPPGWEGKELVGSFEDALGERQRYRVVACARVLGDALYYVVIYTPESIARATPGSFVQLIASTGPA